MRSVLSPADLTALLRTDPATRLLDVRTPAEFEAEHIAGAYNVPLDTLAEHGPEIRAHVTDPVVLVCRSGQRARRAEEALGAAGMTNLHVLDGGMTAWAAERRPVRRGASRISLERQVRIVVGAVVGTAAVLALTVAPAFAIIPALLGSALVITGVTDSCLLAMLLARLPYNRSASCDVSAMVRALTAGTSPAGRTAAPPLAAAVDARCAH
ncbi:MAG TPA: rhodanese-like domain-containing protein [Gemmatimonadaceae bacterium]|jgi:rhodanese-related sulfurtransferase|nr:rhodanese-like domain-containing protein [Gemmatimonadaceae bacterium]